MKMSTKKIIQISWATKIVILYFGFVFLILTLVIMSFQKKVDLVSPNYYHEELNYQERINAATNAASLDETVVCASTELGFELKFPEYFKNKSVKGKILFFRPSDSTLDRTFALTMDSNAHQFISAQELQAGKYIVKVEITENHKNYYFETPFDFIK
jgi:nitrogen fixation protein FixH